MSKTRKILSVVLAAALVFALAIPAFAVSSVNFESTADAATYTQEWSLAEPVFIEDGDETFPDHAGEYYIDVNLKTNYPTGAVEFELLTTGDVEIAGAELYEYYSYTNEEDEMCWDAEISFANDKVMLIPDSTTAGDALVFTQIGEEGEEVGYYIATIFVSGTNGTVAIKNDPKNAENPGGSLIAARLNPAKVTGTMIVGQTATVGAAVTIGTPANPELVVKAGNTTVKIDANKTLGDSYKGTIYGFVATSFRLVSYITDALEVTDGGSMVIKDRNGNVVAAGTTTQKNLGTGATVEVYSGANGTGTKIGTYVIVIFGDCNGDGRINGQDVTIVYNCAGASGKEDPNYLADNSLYRMAANTKNNSGAQLHTVNGQDITPVYNGTVDQSAMATKMFALTGYYA